MGYRVSWIARSGNSSDELLQVSRRNVTGERHEFPDVGWYLLELPNAVPSPWVVLITDGSENFDELEASHAQSLSQDGIETLHFWCSDTVMATELVCFKDSVEVWSVRYDSENKSKQPALNGRIPQVAHEILERLRIEQQTDEGADYVYDLTAELGHSIVGFRHDSDVELDDGEPFQVLCKPTSSKQAWWQFWKS